MSSRIVVIGGIICAVLLIVPLAAIWSLNALFELAIPVTPKTWLAALVLAAMVGTSRSGGGK